MLIHFYILYSSEHILCLDFESEWHDFNECVVRLRNTVTYDYQESVTIGQTGRQAPDKAIFLFSSTKNASLLSNGTSFLFVIDFLKLKKKKLHVLRLHIFTTNNNTFTMSRIENFDEANFGSGLQIWVVNKNPMGVHVFLHASPDTDTRRTRVTENEELHAVVINIS